MRKVILFACVTVVFFTLIGFRPAMSADKPIEWRFYSTNSAARQEFKDTCAWAERIDEKSGGRLKITVYPSGSLGFKAADLLRVLKAGSVECGGVYDGYHHRDSPELSMLTIQGIWKDDEDWKKTLEPLKKIKKRILAQWDVEFIGLTRGYGKWLHIFSKKPIKSFEDMKGKKIRVWSKTQVETLTSLGVAAQIIPQSELYLALKTGVVDGTVYPTSAAKTVSLYEVTKYASRFMLYCDPFSNLVVSKKAWSKLPDDLKQVVIEASEWLWGVMVKQYTPDEVYLHFETFLKDKGVTFLEPFKPADLAAHQKAAFEVWEKSSKKAGKASFENYKVLRAALEK